MKKYINLLLELLVIFGIDLRKTVRALKGVPGFVADFSMLKKQKNKSPVPFGFGKLYPCLEDRFAQSGSARGHYFHQDHLVARRVFLNSPLVHVDVGSRVDGFVAHVASFRDIEVIDIRPLPVYIKNIRFTQADFMLPLRSELQGYCDSLSCLHAVEHFGLGRYGDPVNHDGYLAGLENLHALLKPGGKLYFSVPIGPQRIEFNAHRVFSVNYLLEYFTGKYQLDQFSYVDDRGDLHEDILLGSDNAKNSCGCIYGCGIFEMTRL